MGGVRIVTDSACDLSNDETEAFGIEVVPLTIRFGADEYTDRVQLSVEDFYTKMAASNALPETAAPSPGAFEQAFRTQAAAGADTVLCINISSELSATMQSAQNAARAVEGEIDVRVIDSQSITGGLGTEVLEAAKMAQAGKSADEIVARVEDLRSRTRVFGALDTLDNLKKGGRIGGAQAMIGSMLSIKPIIDISTGRVEEASKQRTRKRSLQWLYDKITSESPISHLRVMHGEAPDIDDFVSMIAPTFAPGSYEVGKIGAVIGTHGGPRVLGVTYVVGED